MELYQDGDGRWWLAVNIVDFDYGPTHGLRKRTRVPVEPNAPRDAAERAARDMMDREDR